MRKDIPLYFVVIYTIVVVFVPFLNAQDIGASPEQGSPLRSQSSIDFATAAGQEQVLPQSKSPTKPNQTR